MIRILLRLIFVGCLITLATLSWTPFVQALRTGLPSQIEHIIAYAGTGFLGTLAFGRRAGLIGLTPTLMAYAAVLEYEKAALPDRHPKLIDFFADSIGALAGCATASLLIVIAMALVALLMERMQPSAHLV